MEEPLTAYSDLHFGSSSGYRFLGWNTKADGTGTAYSDQQRVKNLATDDGATVDLYAQWEKLNPTLPQTGGHGMNGIIPLGAGLLFALSLGLIVAWRKLRDTRGGE